MGDVKQCAFCGAKTRSECKSGTECSRDVPGSGWGCMDHIHPTIDSVINVLSHVLGQSEPDILKRELEIAAEQVCSLEDKLAALREELATSKRNEHNSEVAYKAAIEKQEELREDFDIVSEERDRAGRNASAFEERMGNLQVENGELQQRLTAAEQRNAVMTKALERITRPHDCGCVPCTGSCSSKYALEITLEEIREIAGAALKPTESGASE